MPREANHASRIVEPLKPSSMYCGKELPPDRSACPLSHLYATIRNKYIYDHFPLWLWVGHTFVLELFIAFTSGRDAPL
jgi:hypothetical protein